MIRHFKMMLYGAPGTGKSVFASRLPKPFFITTDGNYEWLLDFGAKEEDHKNVFTYAEFKQFVLNNKFENYETIVLDLTEDLFKWCESEFCTKEKITHLTDMGYGKGYDITRNDFFITVSKLIALEKNIVLLSHEYAKTTKTKKGTEFTEYRPSEKLPDKLLNAIEGRLRYVLRCYTQTYADEDTGKTKVGRYLSLIPKDDEYGIIRGVNTDLYPDTINLDANEFLEIIGYAADVRETPIEIEKAPIQERPKKTKKVVEKKVAEDSVEITVKEEASEDNSKDVKEEVVEEKPVRKVRRTIKKEEVKAEEAVEESAKSEETEETSEKVEEVKPVKTETVAKPMTQAEKIAAIKAKLAAKKNK